jgi:hypothetical protein
MHHGKLVKTEKYFVLVTVPDKRSGPAGLPKRVEEI